MYTAYILLKRSECELYDNSEYLQAQYENLMAMARERQKKLSETVQAYVLVREAAELSQWIKDKEQHAQIEDVGEDLEQVSKLEIWVCF